MKLLYCISLIYSYKVNIVPTFSALEVYLLGVKETSTDEEEAPAQSVRLYWTVNAMRSLVILMTVIAVILVADKLDKFYAVTGALLGMTNVLLLPSICHYKLKAIGKYQKCFDVCLIVTGCFLAIFLPTVIVYQWI